MVLMNIEHWDIQTSKDSPVKESADPIIEIYYTITSDKKTY